jgi:uncharacterized protein (TIGR03435 family)
MRIVRVVCAMPLTIAGAADAFSQSVDRKPVLRSVSIQRHVPGRAATSSVDQRTANAITLINTSVGALIARAYPTSVPREPLKLPEWARHERYDVHATASSPSAAADYGAMVRAILDDRFKLLVHFDHRAQPIYNLIVSRHDGRLGPGLTRVEVTCPAKGVAPNALATNTPWSRPNFKSPPPPCALRIVGAPIRDQSGDGQGRLGDLIEGEATMQTLASLLRPSARRLVIDKTGLKGTYRVRMNFDSGIRLKSYRKDPGPSVFRALEEQLGLKLQSSGAMGEVLIIERLEPPTED